MGIRTAGAVMGAVLIPRSTEIGQRGKVLASTSAMEHNLIRSPHRIPQED
jgi:hypothetical protein